MSQKELEYTFNKYILPHYTQVYYYLCRLIDDSELAMDLTQATMEKAWKNISGLKNTDAAKTWVFSIATNEWKLYFRAQNAKKRLHEEIDNVDEDGESIIENTASDLLEPLEEIIAKGEKEAVMLALQRVTSEYRILINLYLIEELTFNEISAVVDKPNSTVQYQLKKGIVMLRQEFDKIMEGGKQS